MKDVINILHLTDLHFGAEAQKGYTDTALAKRKLVLDKLIDKFNGAVPQKYMPDLIVISGDIGWKGCDKDYQEASKWITNLLTITKLTNKEIIICAGNHDIDRTKAKILHRPPDTKKADENLESENIKLFEPLFGSYIKFCNDLNINNLNIGKINNKLAGVEKKQGINFLVLNSSWYCRGEDDEKNLYIGKPQLENLLAEKQIFDTEDYDTAPITICVFHHPPEWLHETETVSRDGRINVVDFIAKRSHLILCGHEHGEIREPDRRSNHAYLFKGGASYDGNDYENNISLIRIDKSKRTAARNCLTFSPKDQDWLLNFSDDIKEYDLLTSKTNESSNAKTLFNTPTFEFKTNKLYSGREKEENDFKEFIKNQNIIPITGNGGVGKTDFIVKYLNDNSVKEKVIYFDCNEETTIESIIEYCGLGDILKIGNSDKNQTKSMSLIYTTLKDYLEQEKRYLILDNFQYIANNTVLNFIKFLENKINYSKIIILSQHNLIINGITINPFKIEGLDEVSAKEYCRKLIHSNTTYDKIIISDKELNNICQKLEYLPLAINLAIQLLSYGIKSQEVLKSIVDAIDSNENLSSRLLYEIFENPQSTEEEKQFMLQFSIFNYPLEKDDLEKLIDGYNQTTLIKLQDKLMLSQPSIGKFKTHALIREFCLAKINKTTKIRYHSKASKYFLTKRNPLINPILEEKIFFHQYSSENYELINLTIIDYGRDLIFSGHLKLIENMIFEVGKRIDLTQKHNLFLGDIKTIFGEFDSAKTFYEFAIIGKDNLISIEAEIKLAEAFIRKTEFSVAQQMLLKTLAKATTFASEKDIARCLNDLGIIEKDLNFNSSKALEYFEKALEVATRINDIIEMSDAQINIGVMYSTLDKNDISIQYIEKAGISKTKLKDKSGIALTHIHLADLYRKTNKKKEAKELYEKAIIIFEEINEKKTLATSLITYSCAFELDINIDNALMQCNKAENILIELNDTSENGHLLNARGVIYSKNQENEKAIKCFLDASSVLSLQGKINLLPLINVNLGDMYNKGNKHSLSIKHFCLAYCQLQSIGLPDQYKIHSHLKGIQSKIGVTKYNLELKNVYKKTAPELLNYFPFDKNQKVFVKYKNYNSEGFYKKFEKDIQLGNCEIVNLQ